MSLVDDLSGVVVVTQNVRHGSFRKRDNVTVKTTRVFNDFFVQPENGGIHDNADLLVGGHVDQLKLLKLAVGDDNQDDRIVFVHTDAGPTSTPDPLGVFEDGGFYKVGYGETLASKTYQGPVHFKAPTDEF